MKKILTTIMISFLFLGLGSAIYMPEGQGNGEQMYTEDGEPIMRITSEMGQNGQGAQMKIQGGEQIALQDGKTLRIDGEENRLRLQVGENYAECEEGCNMTQEQNRIHVTMSNGMNSEIKIMPDVASERALERLKLKMCENCTLELKEVGEGNETKMAYEMKAQKRAKVLGIFGANMNVEADVDAETGEVIKSRKPWWAFLASESDEAEQLE